MSTRKSPRNSGPANAERPAVNTGNASNPAPNDESLSPTEGSQLLNEKAEKYLREVASIEDVPDAQDQEEMDETLGEETDQ